MKRDDWTVSEFSTRPAGPDSECFYCGRKLGEQHKETCVLRERTVVIEARVIYTISVPEFWTPEDIENHRNSNRWCSNNMVQELQELADVRDCLCGATEFKYIREATEEDEERDKISAKDEFS